MLDLIGKEVRYSPDLCSLPSKLGLRDKVLSWVESVVAVGALFPRVDTGDGDYVRDIQVNLFFVVSG